MVSRIDIPAAISDMMTSWLFESAGGSIILEDGN